MHIPIDWHLAIAGAIVLVLSLPLWLQWVPPGPYGLHVKATYLDDRVWYSANAACGRDLVILGGVLMLLSILIPGTDPSLKVYGQITEIVDYWMSGGGVAVNVSPANTTIGDNGYAQNTPLHGSIAAARGGGVFQQSPRESKIGFETRTPTPFGEARTVMEFDWAGSTTFAPGGGNQTAVENMLGAVQHAARIALIRSGAGGHGSCRRHLSVQVEQLHPVQEVEVREVA